MNVSKKHVVAVLLLTGLSAFPFFQAQAQENLDNLLSMSLEDLMEVEILVASKRFEKASEAPSIISVITAEDIKSYGANNLLDILGRVTSVQTYGSNFFPENIVSIRGQSLTHNANHIIIMINGRPYRDSVSGGFYSSFYKSFPIGLIERIEIIRGPGSVLYGSGAFAGVLNIIIKEPSKDTDVSIATTYGSFNTRGLEGTAGLRGKDWNVMTGFKTSNTDGWRFSATDQNGLPSAYDREDTNLSYVFSGDYNGLTFDAAYLNSKQIQWGTAPIFPEDWIRIKRFFADVGYNHELGGGWNAQYNVTYNALNELATGVSDGSYSNSSDWRLEPMVQGPSFFEDDLNIMLGGSYERHNSRLINAPGIRVATEWWNWYAQADYEPLDWLRLVAGVQWNKPNDVKGDYSPRLSALFKLNDNWGIKLLYGEAFRSSYASERKIDIGLLVGNPSLRPEKIKTTEVQINYSTNRHKVSLTYYHSDMNEIVTRVEISPGVQQFVNSGEIEFNGIELEGKAHLSDQWALEGSVTWQKNKDSAGVYDTTFTPNLMAKAGVTYDTGKGYKLGLFDSYFGDPTQVNKINSAVSDVNPIADNYHLVTVNASVDVNEVLNLNTSSKIEFSIFVDNLLDEDIHYPEINRKAINSIPVHSGRAAYGKLSIKF